MEIYKTTSIQNVIQNITEDTDLDLIKYKPRITRWITYIDREIGAMHLYKKKRCVLTAKTCYLELPSDAVVLLPGILYGDQGTDCESAFSDARCGRLITTAQYPSTFETSATFIAVDGGYENAGKNPFDYKVVNNKLYLPKDYDGELFTVEYLGYETDCDGFAMIRESNHEACNYYVQSKLAETTRWRSQEFKMTESVINKLVSTYSFYVRKARSDAGQPTEQEWLQIREMVNNPLTGLFDAYYLYNEAYFVV